MKLEDDAGPKKLSGTAGRKWDFQASRFSLKVAAEVQQQLLTNMVETELQTEKWKYVEPRVELNFVRCISS